MIIKKIIPYILGLLILITLAAVNHQTADVTSMKDMSEDEGVLGEVDQLPNDGNSNEVDISSQELLVVRVIDGDTIELEGGKKLRYIGIDTPETKHPNKGLECYGREAYEKNKELVEGKVVKIKKDVSETDRYGRLLRYVYVDGVMINALLVREGYAKASSYPPDIKHQESLRDLESAAREFNLGLWGDICKITPTPTPTNTPTPTVIPALIIKPTSPPVYSPTNPPAQVNNTTYLCDCKKTCSQMSSCAEAQYQLNTCGCFQRDGNNDGIPCNAICR